ncbi:MAG: hypothetical protein IKE52_07220 [Mogibacterium sp.]|nr:hypothetical protein [Mogibacterium sp.]
MQVEMGNENNYNSVGIAYCNGNPLNKENVIEYLGRIVDIECNRETCKRICEELNNEYNRVRAMPADVQKGKPPIKILHIILGLILISVVSSLNFGRWWWMLSSLIKWIVIAGVIYFVIANPIIKNNKEYKQKIQDRESLIQSKQEHLEVIKQEYQYYKQLENNCTMALNYLYGLDIIHKTYQNWGACSYIWACLDESRTNVLERTGADPGAYYLYVEELRHRGIIEEFGKLSSKMDIIIDNQQSIMRKMDEMNDTLNKVVDELKTIKNISMFTALTVAAIKDDVSAIRSNTAATAFNTRCAALNTSQGITQDLRARTGISFNF